MRDNQEMPNWYDRSQDDDCPPDNRGKASSPAYAEPGVPDAEVDRMIGEALGAGGGAPPNDLRARLGYMNNGRVLYLRRLLDLADDVQAFDPSLANSLRMLVANRLTPLSQPGRVYR